MGRRMKEKGGFCCGCERQGSRRDPLGGLDKLSLD